MSCSITSLKGDHVGDYLGAMIGVTKGDTRSLAYGSHLKSLESPKPETLNAEPCCWLLGTAEACVVCRV